MYRNESPTELIERLKHIAEASPTDAIDEALRLEIWTPGSPCHIEEILCYCAQLAVQVGEQELAGLAAYQAQWLHKKATGQIKDWGLPMLPGLEVAARDFNLVRHIPLISRNIIMRRVRVSDQEFLTTLFNDADFVRQYSRTAYGHASKRVYDLARTDGQILESTDPWAWIICNINGQQLGLMEFSTPDFIQRSVDLALGFLNPNPGTLAGEAYVLGSCVAFHHLDLVRVTGNIYGDNQRSQKLETRIGRTREYTIEGLVKDGINGEDIPLTVYSMLRHEFQQWPHVKRVMRHFFSPYIPDLLYEQAGSIAEDIVNRGPKWEMFPPPVTPNIPLPDQHKQDSSESPSYALPEEIVTDGIRLRTIKKKDEEIIIGWIKTKGFLRTYPHRLAIPEEINLIQDFPITSIGMRLWLIEKRCNEDQWQPLGLVGIELLSDHPTFTVVSGLIHEAHRSNRRKIATLILSEIINRFPEANIYIKVPSGSFEHAMFSRLPQFQNCGDERQHLIFPDKIRINMTYFKFISSKLSS